MLMIMSNMYLFEQPATVICVGTFDLDLTQGDRWDWSWNSGPGPPCFFCFKRRASIGWTKFPKFVASWDNLVKVSSSTFWDVEFSLKGRMMHKLLEDQVFACQSQMRRYCQSQTKSKPQEVATAALAPSCPKEAQTLLDEAASWSHPANNIRREDRRMHKEYV